MKNIFFAALTIFLYLLVMSEQITEIINPYRNQEVITHRKFVSHLGIAFLDLKLEIKSFMQVSKVVLRKICGQFNYGTLNGIFGPKQSGKTSLLKCLCGRMNEGVHWDTQIYLNEDKPTRVVYLEKDLDNNILLSLTVSELLEYAFRFRNSNKDVEERSLLVKELINNLELTDVRNEELRHCSNDERIRAQLAMSLCSIEKPNMIFIDEPLEHLDVVGTENVSFCSIVCLFVFSPKQSL